MMPAPESITPPQPSGLGSSIVGALDAVVVSIAVLVGLPRLVNGTEVALIIATVLSASGTFFLMKLTVQAVVTRSWTREAAMVGASLLAVNLGAIAVGLAGLARANLQ